MGDVRHADLIAHKQCDTSESDTCSRHRALEKRHARFLFGGDAGPPDIGFPQELREALLFLIELGDPRVAATNIGLRLVDTVVVALVPVASRLRETILARVFENGGPHIINIWARRLRRGMPLRHLPERVDVAHGVFLLEVAGFGLQLKSVAGAINSGAIATRQ
jgi:hypothetical protein